MSRKGKTHFARELPTKAKRTVMSLCGWAMGDKRRLTDDVKSFAALGDRACKVCARGLAEELAPHLAETFVPHVERNTRPACTTPARMPQHRDRPLFGGVTAALTAWSSTIKPSLRSPAGALVESKITVLQRGKPGDGAQQIAADRVASVHIALREVFFRQPARWVPLTSDQALRVVVQRNTRNVDVRTLAADLAVTPGDVRRVLQLALRLLRVEFAARGVTPMPRSASEFDATTSRREVLEGRARRRPDLFPDSDPSPTAARDDFFSGRQVRDDTGEIADPTEHGREKSYTRDLLGGGSEVHNLGTLGVPRAGSPTTTPADAGRGSKDPAGLIPPRAACDSPARNRNAGGGPCNRPGESPGKTGGG